MSHLSTERLAALADETPTADERLHLSRCTQCARELDAHRSLLSLATTEREAMSLPLTRWDSLAERLRAEGLITTDEPTSVTAEWAAPLGRRRLSTRSLLRVAAAIMLVASGAVIGRASTGAPVFPGGITGGETQRTEDTSPAEAPTSFASADEARRWRDYSAETYQNAISFLAANDSATALGTPAVMRARLSALDRVQRAMREALDAAPFDPVINDFYLSSFGQREATLRQLNTVLPEGVRLNSF